MKIVGKLKLFYERWKACYLRRLSLLGNICVKKQILNPNIRIAVTPKITRKKRMSKSVFIIGNVSMLCWLVQNHVFWSQISHVVGGGLVLEICLLFLMFLFWLCHSQCFPHYAKCNLIGFIPTTWLALCSQKTTKREEK